MKHGTYSGAVQHYQRGEKPCEPCRKARNVYGRNHAQANPKVREYQRRYAAALAALRDRHREEFDAIFQEIRA